jgi:hypothetical protein
MPNRSRSSADTPIGRAWEDMRSEAARSTAIESRAMKYETAGNCMGAFTLSLLKNVQTLKRSESSLMSRERQECVES